MLRAANRTNQHPTRSIRQNLNHDRAPEPLIGGFVNRAWSAGARLMRDFVIAEVLAYHERAYLTPNGVATATIN